MGRASQRKGAQGERELAELLAAAGYPVERGGSCFGEKPDLYGLPDIHIEVKRREALNITEAMAQAQRDAEKFRDGHPAVFHRRNRHPWMVTMPLECWMDLYSAFQREKTGKNGRKWDMNNSLRARIAALEGPPPTVIPTVVIMMKDGTRKEMPWDEAMLAVLEDDVADIRQGNDVDMMNLCKAMYGGDDHGED